MTEEHERDLRFELKYLFDVDIESVDMIPAQILKNILDLKTSEAKEIFKTLQDIREKINPKIKKLRLRRERYESFGAMVL